MTDKTTIYTAAFPGQRVSVDTPVSFDEVLKRLRQQMGQVAVAQVIELALGPISREDYIKEVEARYVGSSGFMLFAEIDHGGWLSKFDIHRRTVRWILGNPLIAVTMIRHDITAGLFAPVEILVTEHEQGSGTNVTYIQPSSLMVTGPNPPLEAAATDLDVKLDALVANATAV